MRPAQRRPLIAGNWKMNTTPTSAVRLARAIVRTRLPTDVETVLCPPAISVPDVARAVTGTSIQVGVQNVHWRDAGAYTGEISLAMLEGIADFAIIGHSERRHVYGETADKVAQKVRQALDAGLDVILCVGELLEEREAGQTEEVVRRHEVLRTTFTDHDGEPALVINEPVGGVLVERDVSGQGDVAAATPASGGVTGIIIDGSGLGLRPAMSPRILNQSGTVLYGPGQYDRDYAAANGVVGYAKTLGQAKADTRVQGNPLVLRGASASGTAKTDVIISNADAGKLVSAGRSAGLLQDCRIMFVLN